MSEKERFEKIMWEMQVPEKRRKPSEANYNWFLRQGIAYHNHPRYIEAREVALRCLAS